MAIPKTCCNCPGPKPDPQAAYPATVLEEAGVRLGQNYPAPIVDHGEDRWDELESMLEESEGEDWYEAVKIGALHVAGQIDTGQPFYLLGYSNGGSLALKRTPTDPPPLIRGFGVQVPGGSLGYYMQCFVW